MEKAPTQDLLHRCFFMTFYFFIAAAEASSFSMRVRALSAFSRSALTTASGARETKLSLLSFFSMRSRVATAFSRS